MTDGDMQPDVRAFLDAMAANPRPTFSDDLMKLIRQMPPEQMPSADLPVGDLAVARTVVMPGPGGDLALRLFDAAEERGPGPVIVFYHGGGFVVGSIDTHSGFAAEIARQLDLPVVSVEYRLAPEHRWPAAPDDAEAAARWIADNGAAFGRRFTHLILCGDSAGGTLTITTALALRDAPAALPVLLQCPIYAKADSSRAYPSHEAYGDGYGLGREDGAYFDSAYRPDPHHWRHSPILAPQEGLPPTFIISAAFDPLRDESRAYAAKAIEAGVSVTYREMPGTIHGFATYRSAISSARADTAAMLATCRALIGLALAEARIRPIDAAT